MRWKGEGGRCIAALLLAASAVGCGASEEAASARQGAVSQGGGDPSHGDAVCGIALGGGDLGDADIVTLLTGWAVAEVEVTSPPAAVERVLGSTTPTLTRGARVAVKATRWLDTWGVSVDRPATVRAYDRMIPTGGRGSTPRAERFDDRPGWSALHPGRYLVLLSPDPVDPSDHRVARSWRLAEDGTLATDALRHKRGAPAEEVIRDLERERVAALARMAHDRLEAAAATRGER